MMYSINDKRFSITIDNSIMSSTLSVILLSTYCVGNSLDFRFVKRNNHSRFNFTIEVEYLLAKKFIGVK